MQEAAKESKAALLSPEDQEDVESPLPSNIVQPVRRRGAISAEPINEEDAATYIKKVIYIFFLVENLSLLLLLPLLDLKIKFFSKVLFLFCIF